MSPSSASTDHQIRAITLDGRKYFVCLRVGYDGIEHVGRLRFTDAETEITYQDHAALPGISALDAVRKAKELMPKEVEARCHRALAEKRRFGKLRKATDQMIDKIKYLNRVAIDLEKGKLDRDGGKQELDHVQEQLIEIVRTLRLHAGVEDEVD
ncbi:MAG TPA: hypothetical protein VEM14_07490 [Gemmatimonadaceae bacterium]|nr:hypothetical protein [Gemmatimonadaceae bacterium]